MGGLRASLRASAGQSDDSRTLATKVGVEESTVALQLASEAVPVPVAHCRPSVAEVSPGLGSASTVDADAAGLAERSSMF
jgi:hypothetical protein